MNALTLIGLAATDRRFLKNFLGERGVAAGEKKIGLLYPVERTALEHLKKQRPFVEALRELNRVINDPAMCQEWPRCPPPNRPGER